MSTNGGAECGRPEESRHSGQEDDAEEESEERALNLAKEETTEQPGEEEESGQQGLQAALQAMQAGQMSLSQVSDGHTMDMLILSLLLADGRPEPWPVAVPAGLCRGQARAPQPPGTAGLSPQTKMTTNKHLSGFQLPRRDGHPASTPSAAADHPAAASELPPPPAVWPGRGAQTPTDVPWSSGRKESTQGRLAQSQARPGATARKRLFLIAYLRIWMSHRANGRRRQQTS